MRQPLGPQVVDSLAPCGDMGRQCRISLTGAVPAVACTGDDNGIGAELIGRYIDDPGIAADPGMAFPAVTDIETIRPDSAATPSCRSASTRKRLERPQVCREAMAGWLPSARCHSCHIGSMNRRAETAISNSCWRMQPG